MPSNRKAVCIVGGGFVNKGAEAMVLTVAHAVRKGLADTDIYVRSDSRELEQVRQHGLLPWESIEPTGLVSRFRSKIKTVGIYYKCSAFIDVGGYQFGDPWGEEHVRRMARAFRRCARFGNLVFFMPQAWGPFSSPAMCDAIQCVVNTATLCYVRDKTSMTAVEELVGKKHPRIRFAHDIAWNFQGADTSVGRQLIRDAGLVTGENSITVCVTPNMRVYERNHGVGNANEYVIFLRELITYLCRSYDARIVLMGHELRADNRDKRDDRYLCNLLLESIDRSLSIAHVDGLLTAAQIKAVIGNCDLLLSSRYHALIAALSQGIPVMAIGWSHKYDQLLAEVGLAQNLISVTKSEDKVHRKIDVIMERLPELAATVRARIPEFKNSGREALDEVVLAIEQNSLS